MPSASTKPENKTSVEVESPIKQAIGVVDRKVRNLEKRKGKLDAYREKSLAGDELNKDQQEAIAKYEQVLHTLEFARELQKQFSAISQEADKMLRKQMKKEKSERQNMEMKRLRELLEVQTLLDHMGTEDVRADFRTGKHGAVMLTEENLTNLDELYKLISPSRDSETSYLEQLTTASEHIVNFLDAKDKEVVGTFTYKDLKDLVDQINNCGYFERSQSQSTTETETEQHTEQKTEEEDEAEENEPIEAEEIEPTEQLPTQVPEENGPAHLDTNFTTPEEEMIPTEPIEVPVLPPELPVAQPTAEPCIIEDPDKQVSNMVDDAFFSTGPYNRPRPLQEIVSSVQGSFNFLQDSEIDLESPHMDPAVVAAHPMASNTSTLPLAPSQTLDAFQTPSLIPDDQTAQTDVVPSVGQLPSEPQQQPDDSMVGPSALNPSATTFVSEQSNLDPTYNSQGFSTSMVSQGLSSTTQHSYSTDPINLTQQTSSSYPGMDNTMMGTADTSSVAPSMSMSAQTSGMSSQDPQEKKPFTMNAEAAVFKSMYSSSSFETQNQVGDDQGFGQTSMQNDYQGSGRVGDSYNRGGRGGPRPNRGGRGGVSNGFPRGGRGGSYNSGRGNFNNSRGGRGGFQGYQPRSEYRPDGYQGINNGYNGFNKRTSGAALRGGNGNRGAPRGAPRGGNPRGGRGGFGRPGSGMQQ